MTMMATGTMTTSITATDRWPRNFGTDPDGSSRCVGGKTGTAMNRRVRLFEIA